MTYSVTVFERQHWYLFENWNYYSKVDISDLLTKEEAFSYENLALKVLQLLENNFPFFKFVSIVHDSNYDHFFKQSAQSLQVKNASKTIIVSSAAEKNGRFSNIFKTRLKEKIPTDNLIEFRTVDQKEHFKSILNDAQFNLIGMYFLAFDKQYISIKRLTYSKVEFYYHRRMKLGLPSTECINQSRNVNQMEVIGIRAYSLRWSRSVCMTS